MLAFPWTHHVDAQVRGYTIYGVLMHVVGYATDILTENVFYDSAILTLDIIIKRCTDSEV